MKILLDRLEALETNDILKPDAVKSPGFDKPLAVFKLWQAAGDSKAKTSKSADEPVFELILGRHDATRKIVFSRLGGDPETILPLPDKVLELVPRGRYAFRDRAMTRAISPNAITQIVVRRGATAETLKSPDTPGDFAHWHLTTPVVAPADAQMIPYLVKFLADPHAFSVVAETLDDPKKYGFDHPYITIEWSRG